MTNTDFPAPSNPVCSASTCAFGRICVPSWGDPEADVMFICEAPGFRELEEGRPLVGPAGKIFDGLLVAAGIRRSQVFIANTSGCVDLDRADRRPLPAELDACRPRLLADIERVKPRAIIAMGNISQVLFFPGTNVSKVRGVIRNWNGIPVMATYHPAFAMNHRSPQVAPLIVADIKTALSFIE